MSETGLLSGIYQQAHKYADLVDRVLVNIKNGESSVHDPARKELSTLLLRTTDKTSNDLPTRLLIIALKGKNDVDQINLAQVGKTLLSSEEIKQETIDQLETFAQALEDEEIDAMTRMRRWTR